MNAIRVHEYGDADVLTHEEIPRPEPAADELLVRVHAAGVNPIDWMVREGYADDALDPSLPYVPGWDLSGVVADVGTSVSAFAPGDEVFGLVEMPDPGNAYAEYATVPAEDVVLKSDALTHEEAAAIPMVALTARRALFVVGDVRPGQRVLVHAAAGGVGHIAVQLASHAGASVIGTASARNEGFLRELGVDEFIDYRNQSFEDELSDIDVVLDAVGGETLERSIDVITRGGRIVTLPEPPSQNVVTNARNERNASIDWFSVEPDAAALSEIRTLVENDHLRVAVSDAWPLSEAHAAHRASQRGHVRGKLVLTTDFGAD
ncbi:NADP-dependent oxidoreductase [Halogeometricum borinquense]|uniref:NADP-dependent oxidoreductase n=1 Tax=Halogeometricum borinquense TaxID=60847 RepID=A0A6C0UFD6_9EURY|nr:NADP-dependent oxidoreductase [Halogeometricum borinquense]QIB73920.1 NADP-dependent oxidoreductase [Halogeometricum borinquense]